MTSKASLLLQLQRAGRRRALLLLLTLLSTGAFFLTDASATQPVPAEIARIQAWDRIDVRIGDDTYSIQVSGLVPAGAGDCPLSPDRKAEEEFRATLIGAPARVILRGYTSEGLPLALVMLSDGNDYAVEVIGRGFACRGPTGQTPGSRPNAALKTPERDNDVEID